MYKIALMYVFAHISDLHLPPLPRLTWRQLLSKRLTGALNWRFNRKSAMAAGAFSALLRHMGKQKYRHLVISGDIVNLALPAEFQAAKAKLATLGSAENMSLVLGNHDAYVPGAFAKACAAFAPWIAADRPHRPGAAFPYMRVRGEIAFIGVSTAIATPPFLAMGYFGRRQAAELSILLRQAEADGLFRVVMLHHPPLYSAAVWHKSLWGIKRLQTVLQECGAELVLHGHTHIPTLSYIAGKRCGKARAAFAGGGHHGEETRNGWAGGRTANNMRKLGAGFPAVSAGKSGEASARAKARARIPVVGVAAAGQEFGGRKPPAGYNLFSVNKNKQGQWQCRLQRFGILDADNNIGCFFETQLF